MRWSWCPLIGLLLFGGLVVLAQDGPSQADLEGILKETSADEVISESPRSLGNVLGVIGVGSIDEQVLALGVVLGIAAELEEYQGLGVKRWFKEQMDIELSKVELDLLDLVKRSLKTGHPDVYDSLREALRNLATKPAEQPQLQPGADLAQVLALLQGLGQRLTDLEGQMAGLSQAQPGQEAASAEELAALIQEVEALKERLPDQVLLAGLSEALPRIDGLESEVNQLNRSLAGERGLTIFLIILIILLLAWLVFLRLRQISQAS